MQDSCTVAAEGHPAPRHLSAAARVAVKVVAYPACWLQIVSVYSHLEEGLNPGDKYSLANPGEQKNPEEAGQNKVKFLVR